MNAAHTPTRTTSGGWWRELPVERKIAVLFATNAVINWLVSVRGIVDPAGAAAMFQFERPPAEYTFVLRLWSSFIFMFGCMFWEVSRDVRRKAALIKYNWIEKSLTAGAVTLGFFAGQTPPRMMFLIVLTNWLWIPALLYFDLQLRKALRGSKSDG